MSHRSSLLNPLELQLRNACRQLDERLRAGESIRAEVLFESFPQLNEDADSAVELIYTEFVTREELGEEPTADEFRERFPRWRDRLDRLLGVHSVIGDSTAKAVADSLHPSFGDLPKGPLVGDEDVRNLSAGERWGRYELIEQIGRGGMGVVYKARQIDLDRLVALKLIRSGALASAAERVRFRKEAEAAARLHHSGIVQIFEVGDYRGCPYLSFEYVDGPSLDQRLREGSIGVTEAAERIESLARALHHAHENGVVHRDLKPTNILIDRQSKVSKITDFGLAKLFDDHSKLEETRSGVVIGTPSYMAPEQAAGQIREITSAADVYSLGAILYEHLTGRPPFVADTVLDTLTLVRSHEVTPISRIRPNVPRDLDTICRKCLEKDPNRRYSSALALAEELRRFLNNEPIQARPASGVERTVRWCRRNPTVAALSVAVLLVTLVGMSAVFWQWRLAVGERIRAEEQAMAALHQSVMAKHRQQLAEEESSKAEAAQASAELQRNLAQTARDDAERNLRLAQTSFATSRSVLRALTDEGVVLLGRPGQDKIGREIIERALDFYDVFLRENSDDPEIKLEMARACARIGSILVTLGKYEKAETTLRRGCDLWEGIVAELPSVRQHHAELAWCHNRLGVALNNLSRFDEAEAAFNRSLDAYVHLFREPQDDAVIAGNYINSVVNLVVTLRGLGRVDEAESAMLDAERLQRELAKVRKYDAKSKFELALVLDDRGMLLWNRRRDPAAESLVREALDLRQSITLRPSSNTPNRIYLSRSHRNLADILIATRRLEVAEEHVRQAVVLLEQPARDFPDSPDYRYDLARSYAQLGHVLARRGRFEEAAAEFRKAVTEGEVLVANHANSSKFADQLAEHCTSLGANLLRIGKYDVARRPFERAVELVPTSATNHNNLAWFLVMTPDLAIRDSQRALQHARESCRIVPDRPSTLNTLAVCLLRTEDFAAADRIVDKLIADNVRWSIEDLLVRCMARWHLGHIDEAWQSFDLATHMRRADSTVDQDLEQLFQEAAATLASSPPPSPTKPPVPTPPPAQTPPPTQTLPPASPATANPPAPSQGP